MTRNFYNLKLGQAGDSISPVGYKFYNDKLFSGGEGHFLLDSDGEFLLDSNGLFLVEIAYFTDPYNFYNMQLMPVTVEGDDFTGDDSDPPDAGYWTVTGSGTYSAVITSNQLRISTGVFSICNVTWTTRISGDFDIIVDWNIITISTGTSQLGLSASMENNLGVVDGNNYIVSRYFPGSDVWDAACVIDGGALGAAQYSEVINTSDPRKCRIVRSGSLFTSYRYTSGAVWEVIRSNADIGTNDVQIGMVVQSIFDTLIVDFDNFEITS